MHAYGHEQGQRVGRKGGIKKGIRWQQQQEQITHHHHNHLYTLFNPLLGSPPQEESDFLKTAKRGDHTQLSTKMPMNGKSPHDQEEDEAGECGLLLSLSLHHQRSNASSLSEVSEGVLSPLVGSKFREYSLSEERSVNLDLSIALCGS